MSVYPGNLLTATAASVRSSPASTRTWEWLRNGVAIPAATTTTYRVTEEDIGSALAALQKETNFIGLTSATSLPVGPVEAFSPSALFESGEQGVWFDPSDVANLNWRRNLLTWTEQFDNAAWVKAAVSVSANAAVAPDGTTTADKLVEDTANSLHGTTVSNIFTATGLPYTYSVYVKQAERRYVLVAPTLTFNSTSASSIFDTQTGSWVLSGSLYSNHFAVSAGNGWWRIGFTNSVNDVSYDNIRIGLSSGATVADLTYTGDGTSGVLIWGAQLELGSVATDYQRITDVNTEVIARFPTATLYQDTAGTTPVTTTGQSVGLMLDKSKGLVLGPELVTNGTFDSATGWTVSAQSSITGGVARVVSSDGTYQNIGQGRTLAAGVYELSIAIIARVSGNLQVAFTGGGVSAVPIPTTIGTHRIFLNVTTSATSTLDFYRSGVTDVTFDNVSLKLISGNHAVQATTANRPIYGIHPFGGRRNLLLWSQDFSNAYWTVGAQNLTAISSGRITPNTTLTQHRYDRATTIAAVPHTFSLEVKADGYNFVWLRLGTAISAVFNATTGAATGVPAGATASFTNAGDGYIRVSLSATTAGNDTLRINVLPTSTTADFAGDGTSGILIRNAQLETGSTATAYQRVTTQYDVTEAGVPSVSYLSFNGLNFSMSTSSINFATATSDGQARRNLLTFPTAFDDAAWTKTRASISANSATAPDGTATADKLVEDTTASNTHQITGATLTLASASTSTVSVYVKAAERTWCRIANAGVVSGGAFVNLSTGQFGTIEAGVTASSIQSVGNGWYRVSVTGVLAGTSAQWAVQLSTGNGNTSYTGDGTSGVLLWGAQLETGTTATAFQNIGTDKMTVFAGVRKLSDAAIGIIYESSTNAGSSAGSVQLYNAVDLTIQGRARGSNDVSMVTTSVGAAPQSLVTTLQGDIAGDTSSIRINGVSRATSSADQGTGNYGNYPLFIGARNSASLPLNGNLYSLIVRGAQSTSIFTTATETWVANKTGIVIA